MSKFPYEITRVCPDTQAELDKNYEKDGNKCEYEVVAVKLNMAERYVEMGPRIYSMEVRPDDIWLVTFPKCGTTWTQNIVWNLTTNCGEIGGDEIPMMVKFPFVDMSCVMSKSEETELDVSKMDPVMAKMFTDSLQFTVDMPSPRLIKTHLPLSVLPPNLQESAKVIYVARNPWDCCASYWNHVKKAWGKYYKFKGEYQDFVKMFKEETNEYGSYWNHLKEAWAKRDHPNIHFMWFEDMKADFDTELAKLQKFLGTEVSGDKLKELKRRVNIDTMQTLAVQQMGGEGTPMGAGMKMFFQRKGQVGGMKAALKEDHVVSEWKEWIKEKTQGTDLPITIPTE